jgi:multidrug efflux pump subunit AcrB
MRHRWVVVLACVGVFASTPLLMKIVGTEFVPRDDQSEFEVAVTLPEGYALDRADEVFQEMETRLQKLPGVTTSYTVVGDTSGRITRGQGDVTKGTIYVRLIDLKQRKVDGRARGNIRGILGLATTPLSRALEMQVSGPLNNIRVRPLGFGGILSGAVTGTEPWIDSPGFDTMKG